MVGCKEEPKYSLQGKVVWWVGGLWTCLILLIWGISPLITTTASTCTKHTDGVGQAVKLHRSNAAREQNGRSPPGRGGERPSAALRVAHVPTGTRRSTRLAANHSALPPKCNVNSARALRTRRELKQQLDAGTVRICHGAAAEAESELRPMVMYDMVGLCSLIFAILSGVYGALSHVNQGWITCSAVGAISTVVCLIRRRRILNRAKEIFLSDSAFFRRWADAGLFWCKLTQLDSSRGNRWDHAADGVEDGQGIAAGQVLGRDWGLDELSAGQQFTAQGPGQQAAIDRRCQPLPAQEHGQVANGGLGALAALIDEDDVIGRRGGLACGVVGEAMCGFVAQKQVLTVDGVGHDLEPPRLAGEAVKGL